MLNASGLHKAFAGRAVLRGCSVSAPAGEWLTIAGPSGAGKTTLLRVVAGLERPDAGAVRLDGRDATDLEPHRRGVSMLFQDLGLWPSLTVEGHLRAVGASDPRMWMERFELSGLGNRRPAALSGGERQRLALARAAAQNPRLLLLDEPFTGLDPLLRRQLLSVVREIQAREGWTVVAASHDFDRLAEGGRVALLREGRIEQEGTLEELRSDPRNEWVAAFLSQEDGVRP